MSKWHHCLSSGRISLLYCLVQIQLWDTAGQERFRKSMVQHYYRNVHAVVFVYDITNAASFHSLPAWIEECKQHALGTEVPRILVGNKCDLQDSVQVNTDLAQQFADAHSMPLFETSAKNPNSQGDRNYGNSDHVEAIFMTVAHKLKSQKPLVLSQPPEASGGTINLNRGQDDGGDGTRSWGCTSCWDRLTERIGGDELGPRWLMADEVGGRRGRAKNGCQKKRKLFLKNGFTIRTTDECFQ